MQAMNGRIRGWSGPSVNVEEWQDLWRARAIRGCREMVGGPAVDPWMAWIHRWPRTGGVITRAASFLFVAGALGTELRADEASDIVAIWITLCMEEL